jgi:hypothetical protein
MDADGDGMTYTHGSQRRTKSRYRILGIENRKYRKTITISIYIT